jgi:glycosyltransferase involved in cell wall biosynthesis
MFNIAVVSSVITTVSHDAKKGTENIVYEYIKHLKKKSIDDIKFTLFSSADSSKFLKTKSIVTKASLNDPDVGEKYHFLFETAHISYALKHFDKFDLFHFHIGNGEMVIPFAFFINKPILITQHYHLKKKYRNKFFDLFKNQPTNIYFIAISNSQKNPDLNLNYTKTIYHGLDTNKFTFNKRGGRSLMWAGRGTPDKGLDDVIDVIEKTKYDTKIFPLKIKEYKDWLEQQTKKTLELDSKIDILVRPNLEQNVLISHYKQAKLFLNPIKWEEPFGLVMIESMACGTPVIAYARGSVPEIIKDGVTGFIVNSSEKDRRGDWLVEKTGIDGLVEAVNKIYSMSPQEYQNMRLNCRKHVEKHFTVERMTNEYIKIYKEVIEDYRSKQK